MGQKMPEMTAYPIDTNGQVPWEWMFPPCVT